MNISITLLKSHGACDRRRLSAQQYTTLLAGHAHTRFLSRSFLRWLAAVGKSCSITPMRSFRRVASVASVKKSSKLTVSQSFKVWNILRVHVMWVNGDTSWRTFETTYSRELKLSIHIHVYTKVLQ